MPPIVATGRDLRLDLFRGLALWLIFLDHIPSNIVNWITIRNYGFSDAAEIFVFISGYTAAFVYGRAMQQRGFIVAGARILKRVWQVYVAHVFIFVIFMAQIAYLTASLDNPLYSEEMRAFDFLQQPGVAIVEALLLKFQPNFMDVLPLYIVLLLALPFVLWLMLRWPTLTLLLSVALYAAVQWFHWNLPAYPTGTWYFNPLAWQLIFVVGAWCAVGGGEQVSRIVRSRLAVGIAIAFLVLAFLIVLTWYFPRYTVLIPKRVQDWMYPIDKNNQDLVRLLHFLALALVTVHFIPIDWPGLKSRWLQADDSVRPALAGDLLSRDSALLHRPFRHIRSFPIRRNADINQYVRDSCHGGSCVADHMVRHYRGARFRESSETARRRTSQEARHEAICRGADRYSCVHRARRRPGRATLAWLLRIWCRRMPRCRALPPRSRPRR